MEFSFSFLGRCLHIYHEENFYKHKSAMKPKLLGLKVFYNQTTDKHLLNKGCCCDKNKLPGSQKQYSLATQGK
jgi:hypothetical protein